MPDPITALVSAGVQNVESFWFRQTLGVWVSQLVEHMPIKRLAMGSKPERKGIFRNRLFLHHH